MNENINNNYNGNDFVNPICDIVIEGTIDYCKLPEKLV